MTYECWTGRILWIDLTNKTTREETLESAIYEQFIGGQGLGAYLLYQTLREGVDPLGPENVLLFMNGPLQGLPAPSVGRWSLITKSPMKSCKYRYSTPRVTFGRSWARLSMQFLPSMNWRSIVTSPNHRLCALSLTKRLSRKN